MPPDDPPPPSTPEGPAYEMLWDCDFCGSRGLLGKTHRHCPGCGAPQDPLKRYFPEAGHEVVAENHVYVGADRLCPACESPCSASAHNCGNCGGPLGEAPEVGSRPDRPRHGAARSAVSPVAAPARRSGGRLGCLVAAVAMVALFVALSWNRPVTATVERLSWNREIDVERLGPASESAWCDELPAGAYGISRSREVRTQRQVADGEECSTRRVDQGDGTFVEVRDCVPRFRDEPVYDQRCRFTIDRWQKIRSVTASGDAAQTPRWPDPDLAETGTCRGCERAGPRRESYRVHLAARGAQATCEVPEARWNAYRVGQSLTLRQRVVTGALPCTSLP